MRTHQPFHQRVGELLQGGEPFVCVTIVDSHGSTPADAGSRMIVSSQGLDFGTVGGGKIEAKAIEEAQSLMAQKSVSHFCDWSLKADVGMTCGGRVKLYFEVWNATPWSIVIFGAGHVTQALAYLLDRVACKVTCIDPRTSWLDKLPKSTHRIVAAEPELAVDSLEDDSFVLCMTKGHQSDLPVLRQIFSRGRSFPYLGVIGSRAKAAVLRKELIAYGIEASKLSFHCPVGLMEGGTPIGSHDPAEIAISIAAQLLLERDRWRQASGPSVLH
jgi:xanthine dehydrogenase accessory factor